MSLDEQHPPPSKRVKTEKKKVVDESFKSNKEGNPYFNMGGYRRCTIRKWKGSVLIDIREFYEKDGKEVPGRKGISLSENDFNTLNGFITGGKIDEQLTALQTYDENLRNKATLNEEGEPIFELSSTKRCTVRKWQGTILVDFREFYEKNGKKCPGKKGISVSVQEFETFRDYSMNGKISKQIISQGGGGVSDAVSQKKEKDDDKSPTIENTDTVPSSGDVLKNDDGDPFFDLLSNKRCTVRKWKKKVLIDIREFYEKNNKKMPGKKGISLSEEQYKILRELILEDAIQNQILLQEGKDVKIEEGKIELKKNDDGDAFFELSSDKRCTVRSWNGRILIDIRQTYEKAGKVMPGRQGISLSKEQYTILHDVTKEGKVDEQIKSQGEAS
uniref:Transcriptional coactivator p15 (PC4) C-terminal domain-containing protein n=2 Tax=Eucampia antarctica TaxID=49252 RepID=A0A7S2W2M6_9STRA|mmetsp:Transcript_17990/g.17343  ORF Transcript_17990/g.17343 Transcript_17990/m.17343 type:complete len:387 (+) Transcript_17990:56-1216(+)